MGQAHYFAVPEINLGSNHSFKTKQNDEPAYSSDWIGLPAGGDAAQATLERMVGKLGCAYYLVARFPETSASTLSECILSSNWPATLRLTYDGANHFGRCRIVSRLRMSVRPFQCDTSFFSAKAPRQPRLVVTPAFERAGFGETVAYTLHSADRRKYLFILSSHNGGQSIASPQEALDAAIENIDALAAIWSGPKREPLKPLSMRELECLRWSAEGKTTEDIATILGLSAYTVGDYIKTAMMKLDATSRMQAVARAIRDGLI